MVLATLLTKWVYDYFKFSDNDICDGIQLNGEVMTI